ncbi:hypothetical protein BOTNAR_0190g00030 [Botryotinia narcissicola]|uniref:Uncharacterized protein n=1 Tax=Botryotinia narcissicola TaxID=278944 RepID=A0A4Z1I8S5_9HELO|nr:hypothetical protein BOTNAR_0190g00030 [Botryotinia narcissicola]
MSKLSFLSGPRSPESPPRDEPMSPKRSTSRAMAVAVQQQKTRRRKGSLRKVALLGRGAQRERKESKAIPFDSTQHSQYSNNTMLNPASPENTRPVNGLGLGISDETPRPSMDGLANRNNNTLLPPIKTLPMGANDHIVTSPTTATSPTLTYTSTTDEEDLLSIPSHNLPAAARGGPLSSGSDSYFPPGAGSTIRRRPSQKQKSPLSIGGLSAIPLPLPDAEWDYSETEWWGWVILIVTWIVFVTGMGSCLGVWSWAWDVGESPYAPPEFEDDPTLPIVGYYPALIILTSVMAWVWVVVAWVGMKYFRHAKISGD